MRPAEAVPTADPSTDPPTRVRWSARGR